jgi:hypothetical protein
LRLFFAELFDDVDCAAVLFLLDLVGLPALEFGTQLLGPRRFLRLNEKNYKEEPPKRRDNSTSIKSSSATLTLSGSSSSSLSSSDPLSASLLDSGLAGSGGGVNLFKGLGPAIG